MAKVPLPTPVLASPIIRRVAWHLRRVTGQLDRRFFLSLTEGIVVVVAIAALLITVLEKPLTIESLFDSFNWGIATVLGQGDASFVTSPGGRVGQLAAYPVRGRHARADHRRPRRDGHRFPAQGGPGFGFSRAQGPHHRVRLEQHRPRPDRRAARRRLPAEGRRPGRRSTRTRPGPGVYFVRGDATDAERPRAGRDRGRLGGARLPGRRVGRGRHALDPGRSWPSRRSRRTSGPSPRSTTRATSRTSGGPTWTSCWSPPRSPRICSRGRRSTRACPRS